MHFTVAVITDNPAKVHDLLAPYQENNMGDCPKEYLEFIDVEDEERERYEDDKKDIERIKGPDGKLYSPYNSMFKDKNNLPPGYELVNVSFKDIYPTFEEYLEDYCELEKNEETGKYGYWTNPNAKWDWYQIGGRWQGILLVKENCPSYVGERSPLATYDEEEDNTYASEGYKWVDAAKIKDVEWLVMQELVRNERRKRWEECMEGSEPPTEVDKFLLGIKDGMTKEEFINKDVNFATYAVITPDGAWHDKDDDDKWYNKYSERFIQNANQEHFIIIVDCHT